MALCIGVNGCRIGGQQLFSGFGFLVSGVVMTAHSDHPDLVGGKPPGSVLTEFRDKVHFVRQSNADSPASQTPYCGADAATEEPLPEPTEAELRMVELEQENRQLRDDLRHLQSALASAVGLLLPYHRRLNGQG